MWNINSAPEKRLSCYYSPIFHKVLKWTVDTRSPREIRTLTISISSFHLAHYIWQKQCEHLYALTLYFSCGCVCKYDVALPWTWKHTNHSELDSSLMISPSPPSCDSVEGGERDVEREKVRETLSGCSCCEFSHFSTSCCIPIHSSHYLRACKSPIMSLG